jgi:hypothetical protein
MSVTDSGPFNVYHLGIWNEDYMLGLLKHELRRRGKPIPADLQSEKLPITDGR